MKDIAKLTTSYMIRDHPTVPQSRGGLRAVVELN
jgi:hypothetical protein